MSQASPPGDLNVIHQVESIASAVWGDCTGPSLNVMVRISRTFFNYISGQFHTEASIKI